MFRQGNWTVVRMAAMGVVVLALAGALQAEDITCSASKLASGVSWAPTYSVPFNEGGHLEFGMLDNEGAALGAVTLLQFDVSALAGVPIASLLLETTVELQFLEGGSGAVELYRIDDVHTAWTDIATYGTSDGTTAWSGGADMGSIQTGLALGSSVVTRGDAPGTVYQWEITDSAVAQSLITDWLSKGTNSGLVLLHTGLIEGLDYRSNAGGFPVELADQPRLIATPVPEPGSLVLLLFGAIGLFGWWRLRVAQR